MASLVATQCYGTPEDPKVGAFCVSEPDAGSDVSSLGTAGLEMGTKVLKHGMRASHTADVFLDDCRVPGRCLLGGKDKLDERIARAREGTRARKQAAMSTFEVTGPRWPAQALGIARAAYEYALVSSGW